MWQLGGDPRNKGEHYGGIWSLRKDVTIDTRIMNKIELTNADKMVM